MDDDEPVLFGMRECFTAYGFEVDGATEYVAAQALLAKNEYAVVITDLRLSGTNCREGLDVVRLVRENWPSTRVILLTAYGNDEVAEEAARGGVDHLLFKPQPMKELRQVVTRLMADE